MNEPTMFRYLRDENAPHEFERDGDEYCCKHCRIVASDPNLPMPTCKNAFFEGFMEIFPA